MNTYTTVLLICLLGVKNCFSGQIDQSKCKEYKKTRMAQICVPEVRKDCRKIQLPVKVVKQKLECFNISRTVCTVDQQQVQYQMCEFSYSTQPQNVSVQTVQVSHESRCRPKDEKICTGRQRNRQLVLIEGAICHLQKTYTCVEVPVVRPAVSNLEVSRIKINRKCTPVSISVPKIVCKLVTEEQCTEVPALDNSLETLEVCMGEITEPKCSSVNLVLPGRVCSYVPYDVARRITEQPVSVYGPKDNEYDDYAADSSLEESEVAASVPQAAASDPQAAVGIPQAAVGAPQAAMSVPQVGDEFPQSGLGVPQAAVEVPEDTLGLPQAAAEVPQAAIGDPQAAVEIPQDAAGVPQNRILASQMTPSGQQELSQGQWLAQEQSGPGISAISGKK